MADVHNEAMDERGGKRHWGLAVEKRVYSETGDDPDPEDEWARADVSNATTMTGLRMVGEGCTPDVVACFEPVAGETLHLVWVGYGTGDSFHHESGLCEPIAVYRSSRLANLARAELAVAGAADSSLGIFDEDGSVKIVESCWSGYFDCFEGAYVDSMVVAPALAPSRPGRSR